MKFVKLALVSFAVVGLLAACTWAATDKDEIVPPNAMSAKDVVSKLKDQGATNIRHLEFDNNQWNATTQHGQKEISHKIDAKSGEITDKDEDTNYESAPPSNVLGILEVITIVHGHGLKGIREIEYDDSLWKVEAVKDGKLTKLCLDPIAGDVIWKDTKDLSAEESEDESGDDDSSMKSKLQKFKGAIKSKFMSEEDEDDDTDMSKADEDDDDTNK